MISSTLREIESEVDNEYLKNPIVMLPYGIAMWHLLTACEAVIVHALMGGSHPEQDNRVWLSALLDGLVNNSKWPVRWLTKSCPSGNGYPVAIRLGVLNHANALFQLSTEYSDIETIYTYASYDPSLLTLTVSDKRIQSEGLIKKRRQYEAYDYLVLLGRPSLRPTFHTALNALRRLSQYVDVSRQSFQVRYEPQLIQLFLQNFEDVLHSPFKMPKHWDFGDFTAGDFIKVGACLSTIAFIHSQARNIASQEGCESHGLNNAVLMITRSRLIALIEKVTGVEQGRVGRLIEMLTLGSCGIKDTDPALQPLIPFGSSLAVAPSLIISSSLERNFLVLINRIKPYKSLYLSYASDKEFSSRERIKKALIASSLRFWNGKIDAWGEASEIDLAIISDKEKICMVLELKSFLAPADPREVINKSEEIAKGIKQIKDRRTAHAENEKWLRLATNIKADYSVCFAVLSETSIGAGFVQDDTVPVVNSDHFVRRLIKSKSLKKLATGLSHEIISPLKDGNFVAFQKKQPSQAGHSSGLEYSELRR